MDPIHLLHWTRSYLVNAVLVSAVVLKQLNVTRLMQCGLGNGLKYHHWLLLSLRKDHHWLLCLISKSTDLPMQKCWTFLFLECRGIVFWFLAWKMTCTWKMWPQGISDLMSNCSVFKILACCKPRIVWRDYRHKLDLWKRGRRVSILVHSLNAKHLGICTVRTSFLGLKKTFASAYCLCQWLAVMLRGLNYWNNVGTYSKSQFLARSESAYLFI